MPSLTFSALRGLPEMVEGGDLAALIGTGLRDQQIVLDEPMILVVSSKVVSKVRGLRTDRDRDAAIASHTVRVVAERSTADRVTRIVESVAGPVMAAAGVDASNTGGSDELLLLPVDPDVEASALRRELLEELGLGHRAHLGVVISDTAGRPWRAGQTDFALGCAGVIPMLDHRGGVDHDGRELVVTSRCLVDELAAAADLVKGKVEGTPVAVVTGCPSGWFDPHAPGARSVVRVGASDWFSLGHVEAARAALGVAPGGRAAHEVGIRGLGEESLTDRAHRAVRTAMIDERPGVEVLVDDLGILMRGAGAYTLGRLGARLEVALWAEDVRVADVAPVVDGSGAGRVEVRLTFAR